MKPRPRHAPKQMTREYSETQAFMKVTIAPLHTLTPAMLESIARSHCSKRPGAYDVMLSKLRGMVETRRRCETA